MIRAVHPSGLLEELARLCLRDTPSRFSPQSQRTCRGDALRNQSCIVAGRSFLQPPRFRWEFLGSFWSPRAGLLVGSTSPRVYRSYRQRATTSLTDRLAEV